jgi:FtsH-binding integral membrane protein
MANCGLAFVWSARHAVAFPCRCVRLAVAATYAYGAFVRGRLWVFVALLLSSPVVLFYAEESKSYVFSVFGGVFLGIMFLACLLQERLETRRFIAIALMGLFGVLLCSVQIISVFTAAFFSRLPRCDCAMGK